MRFKLNIINKHPLFNIMDLLFILWWLGC